MKTSKKNKIEKFLFYACSFLLLIVLFAVDYNEQEMLSFRNSEMTIELQDSVGYLWKKDFLSKDWQEIAKIDSDSVDGQKIFLYKITTNGAKMILWKDRCGEKIFFTNKNEFNIWIPR